ncbi:hypothetical protein A3L04_02175 [Thermococcus chitonophagus]|uniref:VapB-type antitoxin n=1 Tax=Thermococcus chitonophagus TaxID=54262 RepID=A0A160VU82_9EURY|nr:hypothetical protein [Thermococcus chitonophagus]ASJ15967.1 hypothetical protein A3L04_02175 [Thermococcus chitonophagus]CUX77211.1 hypothetical protein CHITON_0432 [Thermococcus chitonophagus]
MAVLSIRIPDELKEKMKEFDINWSEEIRRFIKERIEYEERKRTLEKALELAKKSGSVSKGFSARAVREDRDSH